MYKLTVVYEGFENESVEKTLYFHLTETDFTKLQLAFPGSTLAAHLKALVATADKAAILRFLENIIQTAYGERQGADFVRRADLTSNFVGGLAYDAALRQILDSEESLVTFFANVFPRELSALFMEGVNNEKNKSE